MTEDLILVNIVNLILPIWLPKKHSWLPEKNTPLGMYRFHATAKRPTHPAQSSVQSYGEHTQLQRLLLTRLIRLDVMSRAELKTESA